MAVSASAMVTALETALSEQPAGVVEVRYPDGRTIKFDRKQALAELSSWEGRVRAASDDGLTMQRMSLTGDA